MFLFQLLDKKGSQACDTETDDMEGMSYAAKVSYAWDNVQSPPSFRKRRDRQMSPSALSLDRYKPPINNSISARPSRRLWPQGRHDGRTGLRRPDADDLVPKSLNWIHTTSLLGELISDQKGGIDMAVMSNSWPRRAQRSHGGG